MCIRDSFANFQLAYKSSENVHLADEEGNGCCHAVIQLLYSFIDSWAILLEHLSLFVSRVFSLLATHEKRKRDKTYGESCFTQSYYSTEKEEKNLN